MTSLIPASFPALALAHFMALLSPGPDFFLVVGHAARNRLRGTIFLCAGIALGNAVYIILAAAGWALFRRFPDLYRLLELAGAAYMIWLGCLFLRSSRQSTGPHIREHAPLPPGRQFLTGFGSALLNPKNCVFYLTLMTVLVGPDATVAQQVFAGTWMTVVVFAWDLGLAAAIASAKAQLVLRRYIPLVEALAGVVFLLLAVLLVLAPVLF